MREYGGWGLRVGFSGRAYNVRGNLGVSFELSDGKRFLLGTDRANELEQAIKKAKAK
jgi:hypothetical protein